MDGVHVWNQVCHRVVAAVVGSGLSGDILGLAPDCHLRPVHCRPRRVRHRAENAAVHRLCVSLGSPHTTNESHNEQSAEADCLFH